MILPASFVKTTREVFGEAGETWLASLPELVAGLSDRWRFRLGRPFDLSYNYVIRVTLAGGTPAVLKLGFPRPEISREIEALRLYDGRGSCWLLAADPPNGAMLLERLQPGTLLVDEQEDHRATAVAAGVMRDLWRPLPAGHGFRPVSGWAAGLDRRFDHFESGTGPLPTAMVERAQAIFADLFASATQPVLLHGDLHHFNILAAERAPWLAIDPKGVAGEPAYEVGAWLRNPHPYFASRPDAGQVLARRLDQFADLLALDRKRLQAYGFAQAVLSAWWMVEDHGRGWEPMLHVAELLEGL